MIIEIPNEKLDGFNQNSKDHLRKTIEEYTDLVISESRRIESGYNSTNSGIEITSSIVDKASQVIQLGIIPKKKSYQVMVVKILTPILWSISGLIISHPKLGTDISVLWLVVVLLLAFIGSAVDFVKEG